MYLWSLHQGPPPLTKTCATTAQNRPPWDHLYHRLVPYFTAVPYIVSAGSIWRYNIGHKYEQHFWVYQKFSLSLHHQQSLLSVQEEGFLPHHGGKYKSGLMTHQVYLILLLRFLWIHSHQSLLIALINYTRKLSLWPSFQSLHALLYRMTLCRDTCIQTLKLL